MKKLLLTGLLLLMTNSSLFAATQTEKDALAALYHSMNGDSWINNTNWLDGDPCENDWYGVNCVGGNVTWLPLSNNQLSGSIPAEIGNLSNLKYLVLYDNNLTGTIPVEVGNLSNLILLGLSKNQLSGNIPAEIGNLSNLTGLYLAKNQLSGNIPSVIGNLIGLTGLELNNNQLTGSLPISIRNLTNLISSDLSDNHLSNSNSAIDTWLDTYHERGSYGFYSTQVVPTTQAEKDALIDLYNSTNDINWTNNTNWLNGDPCVNDWYGVDCTYGSVTNLNLYNNNLTGQLPESIINLTNFTYGWNLKLGNNKLTNTNSTIDAWLDRYHYQGAQSFYNTQFIPPTAQIEKDALVALYDSTKIEDSWTYDNWRNGGDPCQNDWFGVTCTDGSVTGLDLSNNRLVGAIPAEIGNLTSLTNLNLSGNKLIGQLPESIVNLTNLSNFNLKNNYLKNSDSSIETFLSNKHKNGSTGFYSTQRATATQAEYDALIALYNSTDGENWKDKRSWLDGDPCANRWYGIGCNKDGMVSLSLTHNKLIGQLPLSIVNLANLSNGLSFQHNQLTNLDSSVEIFLNDKHYEGSEGFYSTQDLVLQTEKDILITLYNNLDGDNWSSKYNWLDGDPCVNNWRGVICEYGKVRLLNLSGKRLTGSIPIEIGSFLNLQSLNLSYNQLTGSIPIEIGNLINLTNLNLRTNQLTGGIPIEIRNLINLRYLELTSNQLTGNIPIEVGNLINLTELYLSNNQLTGAIPIEIGNLVNLQTLDFYNNQLSGNLPLELINLINLSSFNLKNNNLENSDSSIEAFLNDQHIGGSESFYNTNISLVQKQAEKDALIAIYNNTDGANWKNNTGWLIDDPCTERSWKWKGINCQYGRVVGLHLNYNQLAGTIPTEIGNLANLKYLELTGNQLTDNIPTEIGNLTKLTTLYLNKNQLTGNIPTEIGNLTDLTMLYLDENQLTGSISTEIGNLTNLTKLNLFKNQLTGNIPIEIGKLTKLTTLYLHNNQLTGQLPLSITNLSNLRFFSLKDNYLQNSNSTIEAFLDDRHLSGSEGFYSTQSTQPDITLPVITLIGPSTINLVVGDSYVDAGATANDDFDGNITDNIVTINPVDIEIEGTYIVTYNVNDIAGNSAIQITRTVIVADITELDTDADGIPDSVDLDDDNDGIPDTYEIANGLDPLDPSDVNLDSDADGYSDKEEIIAGTDINDPNIDPSQKVQQFTLKTGWNIIAPNRLLTLEELKQNIGDNNLLIIQGTNKLYKKKYIGTDKEFLNDFEKFEEGVGYWIKVLHNIEVSFIPSVILKKVISLTSGWNIINPTKDLTIDEIKTQIGDNLLIIQGANKSYKKKYIGTDKEFLNDFEKFEEPSGYWIKVVSDSELNFIE